MLFHSLSCLRQNQHKNGPPQDICFFYLRCTTKRRKKDWLCVNPAQSRYDLGILTSQGFAKRAFHFLASSQHNAADSPSHKDMHHQFHVGVFLNPDIYTPPANKSNTTSLTPYHANFLMKYHQKDVSIDESPFPHSIDNVAHWLNYRHQSAQ